MGKYNSKVCGIVDKLMLARKAYESGSPVMSDAEFDSLEEKLRRIDEFNQYFSIIGSKSAQNKVYHAYPMLSQAKALSLTELGNFAKGFAGEELAVTPKLDGMSVELLYIDGKFSASTRGDGLFGEDCTRQIEEISYAIPGLLHQISLGAGNLRLRGEIILSKQNFKALNDKLVSEGKPKLVNPRNGIVGLCNSPSNYQYLPYATIVIWEMFEPVSESFSDGLSCVVGTNINSQIQEVLKVVPISVFSANDFSLIESFCKEMISKRELLEYTVDGLVFRLNRTERYNWEGRTSHHWRGSIAFKFPAQSGSVVLKSIEWSVGTKDITPVALFDPIELVGANIGRANLHSVSNMLELRAAIGAVLVLSRQGDVIPMLSAPTWGTTYEDGSAIKDEDITSLIPKVCPACSCLLTISEDYKHLSCSNPLCRGRLGRRIEIFCKALGIEFVGPGIADKLANSCKTPIDVLEMSEVFLAKIIGEGNAKRIFESIQSVKSSRVSISDFVAALSVGVGVRTAEQLFNKFGVWEVMSGQVNFESLRGVGTKQAVIYRNAFAEVSAAMCDAKQRQLLTFIFPEKKEVYKNVIGFCITGGLSKKRNDIIKIFEDKGWEFKSTVTAAVQVLICNDTSKPSSKLETARRLGIEILSEEQAISRL